MGNLCAGSVQNKLAESPLSPRPHHQKVKSKEDLKFSASMFVLENRQGFSSVYSLHEKPLGSGAYGEVWLCNHKLTQELRAVKILLKVGMSQQEIDNREVFIEVEILKSLDHPNILKVYEYFEDEGKYYIVMEFCRHGDLFDRLQKVKKFSEPTAAKIIKQIFSALNYLHGQKIIHRDIKLENVLVSELEENGEMKVKLIDFNIATVKKDQMETQGTTDYMAPEVFKGKYDEKCDIWGCGVILYALLVGGMPFNGSTDEEIEKNIIKSKVELTKGIWLGKSKECKEFLSMILEKNPKYRINATQALSHPWILKHTDIYLDQKTYKNTIIRMRTIGKVNKLKEAFTTFMVSQLEGHSSTKMLQEVFHKIDRNGDGRISHEELLQELLNEMPSEDAEEETLKVMKATDVDGNGTIDYSEFLRVSLQQEHLLSKENIRKTFAYFDKDESGTLEREELISWLCLGGLPEDIVNDLINDADANGDGSISLEEFENLLFDKFDLQDEDEEVEL
ncbi:hypothetical protein SteCoe_13549 [Stentor coeruleus]|uniref:non-specific serine/threonine protein kinase n=1 Tax=Stentor coeruleus TaxID=5963 RepID=A0A1R2C832_9CILI|nr:hypothetical protein SteCoe_13549 [Stentor coeruleus]